MSAVLGLLTVRFGLILVRVSACVIALPLLGQLPHARLQAALVAMLTFVLTAVSRDPIDVPFEILPFAVAAVGEVMIGLSIGICARLLLLAGEFAGQIIGVPMGIGFMQVVDPLSGNQLVVTSRLYLAITIMVFLVLGGHHIVIQGLAASLHAWPPGSGIPSGQMGWYVTDLAGSVLHAGVSLAAPVLVSILAVKVGLGLMARSAPKVQVFFIGFALAILVGLAVLITTMPQLVSQLSGLTYSVRDWISGALEAAGGSA